MEPARCEFCGGPVKPEGPRTCQFTTGWVGHRKQGGANAIRLAEREPRWAHTECIDLILRNVNPNQEKLPWG